MVLNGGAADKAAPFTFLYVCDIVFRGHKGGMTMNYSGQIGIALLPDAKTKAKSIALAREIHPNMLDIGGVHHPHATLYHARLNDVSASMVGGLLKDLAEVLPLSVSFYRTASFADKYLFWDVIVLPVLMGMHERTLELARYFTPGEGAVGTESLKLPAEQEENVRRFGHPLMRNLWRPHITVAYDDGGYPAFKEREAHFAGGFDRVALVEIGEYGTVKKILT